jgi:hypothetical protein
MWRSRKRASGCARPLQNAGLEFPHNKRITVNLAPADLPKDSGRFDLPIALGILAASGQIDAAQLAGHEFAGELSLSGELRPVRGALAMSLALHRQQVSTRLVLPAGSAEEAALVPDAQVYRARHLLDVVRQFLPGQSAPETPPADDGWARLAATPLPEAARYADLSDVKGQAAAKRALEIAAAGGHSLLLIGPTRFGQVDAGPALCRPVAGDVRHGSPGKCGRRLAGRTVLTGPLGPAPDRQPPPHGQCGGAGGRRFPAAARRNLPGAPWRAVSR